MSKNKYIVLHDDAVDQIEAIGLCGKALCEAGFVAETFACKCQEREKEFPTGLPMDYPVAIPHCKDEGIRENAICFLKLNKPVIFYRMDDDQEYVKTDMVFNMAIKDPNEHLEALQNLMLFLSDADNLKKCRDLSDPDIIKFFEEKIG